MAALLRHKAVVLVDTIDELIDAADLLARAKPPVGRRGHHHQFRRHQGLRARFRRDRSASTSPSPRAID